MNVIHIMSGYGGGISSFILDKARYFRNRDFLFHVITFDQVPEEFESVIKQTGGDIYRISNPKVRGLSLFYNQVDQIMRKMPEDTFVHCHIRGYRAIPFYLIARKNGLTRFGIHAHTTGLPEEMNSSKNKMIRTINNRLANEKISCGIKASTYLFGERYVRNKEIMHIPNSIQPEKFLKNLDVSKESLLGEDNKNKYIIGHIGRFRTVKNHSFMLNIIKELSKADLDFLWVFIGDGDDFEKVKKQAAQMKLNHHIMFLGRRNDIPELLQIMDVFVLPSLYEGFPTVAVEAQASGTKTLLSDRITKEVDLELDLLKFLSIDDPSLWANEILNNRKKITVSPEDRLDQLEDKKLTNEESAELYQDFLEKKITHYEQEDELYF